jgi:hypothetical protein
MYKDILDKSGWNGLISGPTPWLLNDDDYSTVLYQNLTFSYMKKALQ